MNLIWVLGFRVKCSPDKTCYQSERQWWQTTTFILLNGHLLQKCTLYSTQLFAALDNKTQIKWNTVYIIGILHVLTGAFMKILQQRLYNL